MNNLSGDSGGVTVSIGYKYDYFLFDVNPE